jgi:hypothetical protein
MMPVMVKEFGLRSALKLRSWLSTWSKYDPAEPHLHLGPIGVEPERKAEASGGNSWSNIAASWIERG